MNKFGVSVDEGKLPKVTYRKGDGPWGYALYSLLSVPFLTLGVTVGPSSPLIGVGVLVPLISGVAFLFWRSRNKRYLGSDEHYADRFLKYFRSLEYKDLPADLLVSSSHVLKSFGWSKLRHPTGVAYAGSFIATIDNNTKVLLEAGFDTYGLSLDNFRKVARSNELTNKWLLDHGKPPLAVKKPQPKRTPPLSSPAVAPKTIKDEEVDSLIVRYTQAARSLEDVMVDVPEGVRAEMGASVALSVKEFTRRAGLVKNLGVVGSERKRKKLLSSLEDDCLRLEVRVADITELVFEDPNLALKEISAVADSFLKAERSLKSLKVG